MSDATESASAVREKDRALAERCVTLADQATRALGWVDRNAERVGAGAESLRRTMREAAVNARRLGRASERPMSVGFFGVSQAGKSTLIGNLVTPPHQPTPVVFDTPGGPTSLNYVDGINPQGGEETTGLVTRLSIRRFGAPPPDKPVALRLFREVDVLKILANTFTFDLSAHDDAAGPRIGGSALAARLAERASRLSADPAPSPTTGLSIEDLYELESYVEEHLRAHPLADREAAGSYWTHLGQTAPKLSPERRAKALSPLWGDVAEFTELYLSLKRTLDDLGHSEAAYAPLEAVSDRRPGRSLLHAGTVYMLDAGEEGGVAELELKSDTGAIVCAPASIVTALTAELRLTLERPPWPFFTHTDLLDFPGARSREASTPADFLRNADHKTAPKQRAHCFLRGKVAVLFDNYAADLDLNAMSLCVGPEMPEVKTMTGLVRSWVDRTQGASPKHREARSTALFFCATKADAFFTLAGGDSFDEALTKRLTKNLGEFGPWVEEWRPGESFQNTYFVRHAGRRDDGQFAYDADPPAMPPETREIGLSEAFAKILAEFRPVYEANAMVRRHVARPAAKLDALLALNDGGVSLLAEDLAPVCDPDLKYRQVEAEAAIVAKALVAQLSPYFESEDPERRAAERILAITDVAAPLRRDPSRTPEFAEIFHLSPAQAAAAYATARRAGAERGEEGGFYMDENGDLVENHSGAASAGRAIVAGWLERVEARLTDADIARRFDLSADQLSAMATEFRIAVERLRVAEEIDRRITVEAGPTDMVAAKVGAEAAVLVNDLVNFLGQPEVDVFSAVEAPSRGAAPSLPVSANDAKRARLAYAQKWIVGLTALVRANAMWSSGGTVDPVENRTLGEILARVSEVLGQVEAA